MFQVFQTRAENFATYIVENKATIRQTAKQFNYSKSLVHNDVSNKLKNINFDLYIAVKRVLDVNFKERHYRGGQATKEKFLLLKQAHGQ
jgi:putative DeoR family transcriptional regulator (stage III sporulation protein D)